MKTQVDIKSVVIGLLIGVIVVLALGAATEETSYTGSVACNDIYAVFTRVNTRTGEIVAKREAISRLSPAPQTCVPAPRP